MLNVTKSFLPDIEDYIVYLRKIWKSGWLTNHGPYVSELESRLKEYLGVKHLFFVNNGTIALQIALKAVGAQREVITTPFSYVATASSIVWENCTPVFADIDPKTLCICPKLVEEKITPNTTAIVAVHVYGTPCAVEALHDISQRYQIPVIYDAAHAFGVKHQETSVLNYGAISTLSFHATKVFHTIEGGAIVTADDELAHRISFMRNFGHNGPTDFYGVGVNGKCSEFNAAMGLSILPKIGEAIESRKQASERYDQLLSSCFVGVDAPLRKPQMISGRSYNYAYYPVLVRDEDLLLEIVGALKEDDISARRYFYPSLNKLPYLERYQPTPVSEDVSARVLCLPLFPGITNEEQDRVVHGIHSALQPRLLPAANG
jgi:dTDP-4-amino-4,6-dideoxygalactose transaminase